ncbi:hypothetical protein GT022_06080 [Agaribacter marinus]|uniref:Uncharacterized protein n=1 Tax=Virgibacillus salarius TaxID=447199 RepID=A0A941DV05_9BACI|nr:MULTISPECIES: hypothetical protein [Bacillaceae]MBR7795614.1 hypothetical protein [Virgibacillus salarius]MDY7046586.1 hypothetical protein [Virgibacillus sp. M23]NAZ08327.1 hypothetical protein [Agaribacter marinus]WBX81852.1 hypothetical protein PD280_09420 [Virgibacillus salarius]
MFKHYNMNQIILPLDLEIKLQENDIAYTIHHVIESISVQLVRIASGFILHIIGSKPPPHAMMNPIWISGDRLPVNVRLV